MHRARRAQARYGTFRLLVFVGVVAVATEAMLLLAPHEEEYLLPVLPMVLLLLGLDLGDRPWALGTFLVGSLKHLPVSVSLLRGTLEKCHIAPTLGVWREPGHVIAGISKRLEIQLWLASGQSLRDTIGHLECIPSW